MIARLTLWWRALTRRRRFEAELDAELAFHRDARRDDLVAQGLDPAAAMRQAQIELGAQQSHRDDCRRARGLDWVDAGARDLRYALRGLWRNPGYSVTALSVLAIAIAANVLLFAMFNAYALRNPPLERVERWVSVISQNERMRVLDKWTVEDADALLREPPPIFEGLYGFRSMRLPVVADVVRSVSGEAVSDNYFELLGVRAARGRTFVTGEHESTTPGVVLSDLGWQRLAHADPDVLGRTIEIAGRRFAVIGVMPPDFTGLTITTSLYWMRELDYRRLGMLEENVGFWLPIDVGGFLREGASVLEAEAALTPRVLAANATKDEALRIVALQVQSRRGYLRPDELDEIVMIGTPIAFAFVLLLMVAAANLANLVLARFAARQRELAVRVAVGAPRRRLVTQLFTECALLAVVAAGVGYVFAAFTLAPLHDGLFSVMRDLGYDPIELRVDARVFFYGLGLSLLAALTFGGVPALIATAPWRHGFGQRPDLASLQRAGSSRLRSMLMVAQLAASVVLLILASLVANNARRAEQTVMGYDPSRLIAVDVDAPDAGLIAAFESLPQVEAVGATSNMPLMRPPPTLDTRTGGESQGLAARVVDASFFHALQLDALRGRLLARNDESGASVVVISRATAERLWPGADPLGRVIELMPQDRFDGLHAGSYDVVGVVDDIVSGWFVGGQDASALYFPGAVGERGVATVMLRVRDDSHATLESIRQACARTLPEQNCELMPLSSALQFQRLPFVIASSVSAALGWIALAISCLGLYGLVSYLVLQKRREIGVRLALGASSGRVARQMLGQAGRQIGFGLAIGWPLAFGVSLLIASLTDKLSSFDLVSFGLVPLGLALLAALAAWIPARRTAQIRPTEALRED